MQDRFRDDAGPESRIPNPGRGASLIEALVAIGLIAGALVAMADVAAQSVRSLTMSRDRSMSTLLAVQKIEQLLAQPSRPPDSPAGTLESDTSGYVEYLDADGRVAGQDRTSAGVVYGRRWSVAPLERHPSLAIVIVRAGRCRPAASSVGSCDGLGNGSTLAAARTEAR
ncbi:MAG: hypothetical protein AB1806_19150 [Acidobacteriota bacterium]